MNNEATPLRLAVLGVVVVSLFAALFARLWYLQVMDSQTFKVEAQSNQVRLVYTPAPRGRILDRNGKVIVDNREALLVSLSRNEYQSNKDVADRLSALLNIPKAEIVKRVEDVRFSPYAPVPIAEDVDESIAVYIGEHADEFPGVKAGPVTERVYPNGTLAAHLLGYVGQVTKEELDAHRGADYRQDDEIGKSGVERTYEKYLRGKAGVTKLEVNSAGRVLNTLGSTAPVQGNDVQLTLDLDLQKVAEESLAQGLGAASRSFDREERKGFLAPAGSLVMLDPKDGSVVAMASSPTYDPTSFVKGITTDQYAALTDPASHFPLNNRSIQGLYSPGSTFKLVTSLAAMRNGVIDARTTFVDGGRIKIGNRYFQNAGRIAHGRVNLSRALTVSSDVFYYTIGASFWNRRAQYNGKHPMQEEAKALGMGERTGIPLLGEAKGRIPDPDIRRRLHEQNPTAFPNGDWRTGDNVNLAIGQGEMAITPLQLANAYAAFANGGTLWQPRVAAKVLTQEGKTVATIEPRQIRKVAIPQEVREPILAGLKGVVADGAGTARPAFAGFPLATFPVAGKTGTAQVYKKQDTALFAAFAPADDPRYCIAVVLEESGFGGAVAAPVARRIFQAAAGAAVDEVTATGGND